MAYKEIRARGNGRLLGEFDPDRDLFRIKVKGEFYVIDLEEERGSVRNPVGTPGQTGILPSLHEVPSEN